MSPATPADAIEASAAFPAFREISKDGYTLKGARRANHGGAPQLQWIAISDLVVDDRYQRPIRGQGKNNVTKIATDFRWSRFAPVIVSPVEGGRFAIVDGQHRTTAAHLIGIEKVPCQVIIADSTEQADAFKAINGHTTRISTQALHKASVASGDEDAVALEAVARIAGVRILRSPAHPDEMKAGDTYAVAALIACLRTFGRETLITALQCVTQTENNHPGILTATVIRALCEALKGRKEWLETPSALFDAFDVFALEDEIEKARLAPKPKGTTAATVLAGRIAAHFASRFEGDQRIAA